MSARHDARPDQEDLLDEALEETFPASDSIAPATGLAAKVEDSAEKSQEKSTNESSTPATPDPRQVTLDASGVWDPHYGLFWIRISDSPQFAAVAVLGTAPLPLQHLDRRESASRSLLGTALQDRLQQEVNAAIIRGGHQVATGIMLVTHQEMNSL